MKEQGVERRARFQHAHSCRVCQLVFRRNDKPVQPKIAPSRPGLGVLLICCLLRPLAQFHLNRNQSPQRSLGTLSQHGRAAFKMSLLGSIAGPNRENPTGKDGGVEIVQPGTKQIRVAAAQLVKNTSPGCRRNRRHGVDTLSDCHRMLQPASTSCPCTPRCLIRAATKVQSYPKTGHSSTKKWLAPFMLGGLRGRAFAADFAWREFAGRSYNPPATDEGRVTDGPSVTRT